MNLPEENTVLSPASPGKAQVFGQRLLSTVILLGLLCGVVCWNNMWGYHAFVWILCSLTAVEWSRMIKLSGKAGQPWLVCCFGVVYPVVFSLIGHAVQNQDQGSVMSLMLGFSSLALAALVIVSFIWEMRRAPIGSRALRSVATTLLACVFPVWMFSFVLLFLSPDLLPVALFLIIYTKATDIFAYVSGVLMGGKLFKDRKFIPHISPKKTWEGLLGSAIISISLGTWVVATYTPASIWVIIPVLVVLFWLAVAGDLAGSLLKRSLSIKDSGALLPGIGGVFDLIDSPAFTVPVVLGLLLFM